MNNEQRALATLDLTLKNAFETLNKYAIWASTPESDVTFNLVDAIPTINSSGSGVFLKPLTVPSFASVRSSIFGTVSTTASRDLYWNLNFKATTGWTFSNSSTNSANPAKLNILVDTYFGSSTLSNSIYNTNIIQQLVNSSITLDANSKIIINNSNTGNIFQLDSNHLKAQLAIITLGTPNSSVSLFGNSILLTNVGSSRDTSRDVLRYTNTAAGSNTSEVNSIILGPGVSTIQSTFATTINSGSLNVNLISGRNFSFDFLNGGSLLKATYSTPYYDTYLAYNFGNIRSLNVGDVSTFDLLASTTINIHGDYGSISADTSSIKLSANKNLTLTSKTKTSIGSQTSLNIGVDNGSGTISNEILVTAGSVVIPNLYVQKKANYQLSGVKHVSKYGISPSVIYMSDSYGKTISNDSYAYEYSKNITNLLIEPDSNKNFDTTFNDHATGTMKSYLVTIVGSGLKLYHASSTYVGSTLTITSTYQEYTPVGLTSVNVVTSNAGLRTISTPNGMYIFVNEKLTSGGTVYNVYYSTDCINFSKIHSYNNNNFNILDISIDYHTVATIDYIWFTHSTAVNGIPKINSDITTSYTYILYYLENNCTVVTANIFNSSSEQIVVNSNLGIPGFNVSNNYARSGTSAKVIVYYDTDHSYAYILGTFATMWQGTYYTGPWWDTNKNLHVDNHYVHSTHILKYLTDGKTITQSDLIGFSNDNDNAPDLLGDGNVLDFSWNSGDTPNGTAIFSQSSITKKITFTSSAQVSSSTIRSTNLKYNDQLGSHSTSRIIEKILITNDSTGDALISENDTLTYVAHTGLLTYSSGHIISSLGIMYFNTIHNALNYYDAGLSEHSVDLVINKTYPNSNYDLTGAVIDYIGVNCVEFGSFSTHFLLTGDQSNDFKLSNNESATDRKIYVEKNNNDITSIIESSNSSFITTNTSSILNTITNPNSSILISLSNVYDPSKSTEITPVVIKNSSTSTIMALNIHIEPISYLVKNRNMNLTSVSIGGYIITLANGVYVLTPTNNPYSGYRIPYYSENIDPDGVVYSSVSNDQLSFSNILKTSTANSYDMNNSLNSFYVTIFDDHCNVHNQPTLAESTIVYRIPHKLIDPTDAGFDPSCAIVNEFSNVVSLKLPYMFGFRSQNCGKYVFNGKSNLILGLTEVAEIGGGC